MSRDTCWSGAIGAGMNVPAPNQELINRRQAAVAAYMASYVSLYLAQERALKEVKKGYESARSWEEMRRLEVLQERMNAALTVFAEALRKGNGNGSILPLPKIILLKRDKELATAYAVAKKGLEGVNAAIEVDENTRRYLKSLDSWSD